MLNTRPSLTSFQSLDWCQGKTNNRPQWPVSLLAPQRPSPGFKVFSSIEVKRPNSVFGSMLPKLKQVCSCPHTTKESLRLNPNAQYIDNFIVQFIFRMSSILLVSRCCREGNGSAPQRIARIDFFSVRSILIKTYAIREEQPKIRVAPLILRKSANDT